jgi:serine/threonine-protein kinase
VGEVIAGRYELHELLGSGGMSSVYRAHDKLLERDVALKILHEHHHEDEEYVERFRREARAVAQLSHPNIVTVIDRGEEDGRQFIVFEYVAGETLKDVVDSGPLDVPRALEVTIAVARGLGFAHRHGIIHRDVKPQNVLLNQDGQAKVTDFGIARSLDVEGMTESGTVLGTSNYIAPEQATGQDVDVRTDVYSLGAVLFELLTGEVPFTGDSFVAVAMKHVHEPTPSVLDLRRDVPIRVALAVERALEKQPADRFGSMEELVAELEACVRELDGGDTQSVTLVGRARPRPGRRSRQRPAWLPLALVAAAVLLLAAALLGVLLADGTPPGLPGDGNPGPRGPIELRAVAAYDPEGGDGEHDSEVGEATDGDPGTDWATESYSSFDKEGVGLVLDAGVRVAPTQIVVTSSSPGFTAEIRTGLNASRAVSDSKVVGARTVFPIQTGASDRYFVVWITDPNGRARINEVSAR